MVEDQALRISHINGRVMQLLIGDITEQACDALVNAANSHLQLGAGVAGAIRAKGGATIQQECDRIGGTPVGTAVATGAGNLAARYVIHAVGPRMGEGDEEEKLAAATWSALTVAEDLGVETLCLPAISTGIFGFPVAAAARIMLQQVRRFLRRNTCLRSVTCCLFSPEDFRVFDEALQLQEKLES